MLYWAAQKHITHSALLLISTFSYSRAREHAHIASSQLHDESTSGRHLHRLGPDSVHVDSINTTTPLRNFQLSVPPASGPETHHKCTVPLVQHTFANSWGKPAVVDYSPPDARNCGSIDDWSAVVLNYTVTSNGTQYDRLSSVYLNHVEILRTSTSEPTRGAGIYWTVLKDVTSYARLFEQPGHVILDLGNGIDLGKNLDGEFAVSLSADFYVGRNGHSHTDPHADFILPISNLRTDLPNYFSIEENGEPGFQWIKLPSNTERAVVEIYASGNAREEFWYTNIPDALASEFPDMLGKGSFREISLSIDDMVAGYAFPFPVIFSGGIVPTAWRPMIAYGAYDQPTYNIDITPLLPMFAGRTVKFAINVHGQGDGAKKSIYGNWFVSGNVKAWTGENDVRGRLLAHEVSPLEEKTVMHVSGRHNASIVIATGRKLKISAEVNGKITSFEQDLSFVNRQRLTNGGRKQHVEQVISGHSLSRVAGNVTSKDDFSFPLRIFSDYSDNKHFSADIQLGYHRNTSNEQLDVVQKASGQVVLNDIGRVVNGTGHSRGRLTYKQSNGRRYEHRIETEGVNVVVDEEKEWRWAVLQGGMLMGRSRKGKFQRCTWTRFAIVLIVAT